MRVQQFTFFEAVNSESNVLRAQSTVVTAAGDGNPNKRIAARKKGLNTIIRLLRGF